jgi:hypothetical protein
LYTLFKGCGDDDDRSAWFALNLYDMYLFMFPILIQFRTVRTRTGWKILNKQ